MAVKYFIQVQSFIFYNFFEVFANVNIIVAYNQLLDYVDK